MFRGGLFRESASLSTFMKLLLVWVILSATATVGKCAVDFQSAPLVRRGAQISEAFRTFGPPTLHAFFFVEVFSRHAGPCGQIRKPQQWDAAAWAFCGWLQKSRHAPTVADEHGPRKHSPRTVDPGAGRLANGGLSL